MTVALHAIGAAPGLAHVRGIVAGRRDQIRGGAVLVAPGRTDAADPYA